MSDETAQEKPLRVLHIGKYFPPHPGGMETYLRDLMSVQHRQGITVTALVHSSNATLRDREIEVDALDGTAFHVRLAARWFNIGFIPISPLFWLSAIRTIRRFRPDVIHMHHPNASLLWLLILSSARRIPWVSHWHSDINMVGDGRAKRLAYFLYRPIERALLKKSVKVLVTTTEYMTQSIALRAHRHKCATVPLGLDESRMPKPWQISTVPRPAGPLALFLGRLASYKGLSTLIAAIDLTPDFNCWIAGTGTMHRQLAQEIYARNLGSRVKLIGEVGERDKWSLLATADLLVLPSNQKTEAFGLVMLEAASLGKPIIATSISGSGTRWVASQLPSSKIIPINDPQALSNALNGTQILNAHKRSSENRIPAVFALNTQAQEITGIYLQILDR